jgi:hypothetical protein
MNTAPVAVYGISPTALPIRREGLGDHFFCCDLLENFELGWRGFTEILLRILVVRIGRVLDISHICNNNASMTRSQ